MSVTIYHNNRCGTSRAVLEMIRETGTEPIVIDYMKTPPEREVLLAMLVAMDMPPRALLRTKEPTYAELGLSDETLSDRALLDAMLAHPQLIERPVVISDKGVRLCRPKETVLEIL
ncbi:MULTISPECIES: arsenate reductase (glutaredoxin) [unclassified Rhizobium]|uniref:arsenate reductase (glutaredoxin) n=1 Tax=unclassified Rhizobium TaxID=2613769 RepID=UPI0006F7623C|nr:MULTISPECIES: arsenate reductase (glutaredoxin) [unclassified Rhizobium]KQV34464.1 arsenate reductase [Rhizobium sp. Root1212]KRD23830.1 arsenate reductase [Rhizobium sp. Root268]